MRREIDDEQFAARCQDARGFRNRRTRFGKEVQHLVHHDSVRNAVLKCQVVEITVTDFGGSVTDRRPPVRATCAGFGTTTSGASKVFTLSIAVPVSVSPVAVRGALTGPQAPLLMQRGDTVVLLTEVRCAEDRSVVQALLTGLRAYADGRTQDTRMAIFRHQLAGLNIILGESLGLVPNLDP